MNITVCPKVGENEMNWLKGTTSALNWPSNERNVQDLTSDIQADLELDAPETVHSMLYGPSALG